MGSAISQVLCIIGKILEAIGQAYSTTMEPGTSREVKPEAKAKGDSEIVGALKQMRKQNDRLQQASEAEKTRLWNENQRLMEELRTRGTDVKIQQSLKRQREAAIKKWGIDSINKFNYALTGNTGVGKSSLLNALLGLDPASAGAARVSVVEGTQKPTPYSNPSFKSFVFWDLPGAGTRAHPVETYYEDNALHAFDAIIIVTGERIAAIDLEIAKQSQEAGRPILFVRSKADSTIKAIASDENISMAAAAAKFRETVKNHVEEIMGNSNLKDIHLLLVSSRAFYSNKRPYQRSDDTSLAFMDEPLFFHVVTEIAESRFSGSRVELESLKRDFSMLNRNL